MTNPNPNPDPSPSTGRPRPRRTADRSANSRPPAAPATPPKTTTAAPGLVGIKAIKALLDSRVEAIRRAIPQGVQITAEGLISNAILQMEMSKDRNLKLCLPISVLYTVLAAASAGLDFIGDQAFLAAMSKKRNEGGELVHSHYVCTLIPGYRGFVTVAGRFGWFLDAQDVREGDDISIDLGSNTIVHKLNFANRGAAVIGATCVVRQAATGRVFHVEVMNKAELDAISTGHDSWKYWYGQMGKKAVVRRAYKFVPKDRYDARMLEEIARRNDAEQELDPALTGAGDDSVL